MRMEQEQKGRGSGSPDTGVIVRRELESVMQRAAALYLDDSAEEPLDEAELVSIAAEVGIPASYVRQALYERARGSEDTGLADRLLGPERALVFRTMDGSAPVVLGRLEDHLIGEQYLRLVRRSGERRMFAPADDTITRAVRAITRPRRRYPLTRLRRLELAVRPLDEQSAHVAVAADMSDQRRRAVVGSVLGSAFSALAGAGAAVPIAIGGVAGLGPEMALAAGTLSGAAVFAAGSAGSVALAGRRFRRRVARIRFEVNSLLDRLEHGASLATPPAPWRHRIGRRSRD